MPQLYWHRGKATAQGKPATGSASPACQRGSAIALPYFHSHRSLRRAGISHPTDTPLPEEPRLQEEATGVHSSAQVLPSRHTHHTQSTSHTDTHITHTTPYTLTYNTHTHTHNQGCSLTKPRWPPAAQQQGRTQGCTPGSNLGPHKSHLSPPQQLRRHR